jgi:glycosyltransferase involved in cell wall biosynthesis
MCQAIDANVLLVFAGEGRRLFTGSSSAPWHWTITCCSPGALMRIEMGGFRRSRTLPAPLPRGKFRHHIAEAMQMAIPVITSDKVNTWPYVKEARAGRRDINSLLPHAIEQLLKDDITRSEMGVRGSHYASKRLSWHASAKKLLACYNPVLSCVNTDSECNGS